MADAVTRLVVDCSVVVKWKIPTEDHAAAAESLFIDWEHQVVDVAVPNHFPSEVISAFLRASRRDRITIDEAREAIRDLLALPFVLCDVTAIADRAFAIAESIKKLGIRPPVALPQAAELDTTVGTALRVPEAGLSPGLARGEARRAWSMASAAAGTTVC